MGDRRASASPPLAISTGSLWPRPTGESLGLLAGMDLRRVELVLQPGEFAMTFAGDFRIERRRELVADVGAGRLAVPSVHAPQVSADHGHSARARLAYLERSIDFCAELASPILVVHPFHLLREYEQALAFLAGELADVEAVLLPGLPACLRRAAGLGVCVALENIQLWADDPTCFFNAPGNLLKLLAAVDSPALKMTLDVNHAAISGTLEDFLAQAREQIVNVHVADADAGGRRVAPGRGTLDWDWLWPALTGLPRLSTLTLELAGAAPGDIRDCLRFLAGIELMINDH